MGAGANGRGRTGGGDRVDAPGRRHATEDGAAPGCHTYVRRRPEQGVLHQVVREHLETFLDEVRIRGGGEGLPWFVERELRKYLGCGVMASRFARFKCSGCTARDPGRFLV